MQHNKQLPSQRLKNAYQNYHVITGAQYHWGLGTLHFPSCFLGSCRGLIQDRCGRPPSMVHQAGTLSKKENRWALLKALSADINCNFLGYYDPIGALTFATNQEASWVYSKAWNPSCYQEYDASCQSAHLLPSCHTGSMMSPLASSQRWQDL